MTRHRRVETGVWNDRKFRQLSKPPPNGQTLWMYLLCGQRTTTFPGLVTATEIVIASDLGWPLDADLFGARTGPASLRDVWKEISDLGMAEADWQAGVIVLPRALLDSTGAPRETSRPGSPNALRGWAKAWSDVPECDLKDWYLAELGRFVAALDAVIESEKGPQRKTYSDAYVNAFATSLERVREIPGTRQRRVEDSRARARDPVPDPDPVLSKGGSGSGSAPSAGADGAADPGRPGAALVASPVTHAAKGVPIPRLSAQSVSVARMVERFRDAVSKAREAVVAKHGLVGVRTHITIHGGVHESDLQQRLRAAGDRAEADLEHVIAVATADAMTDPDKIRWLGWNLSGEKVWDRCLRSSVGLAAKPPQGARRSVFDVVDDAVEKLERMQEAKDKP